MLETLASLERPNDKYHLPHLQDLSIEKSTLAKILSHLATLGPGFLVAAVFALLLFLERKKSEKMAEKLLELAQESIKAETEHTKAIEALEKTLDSIDRRLS